MGDFLTQTAATRKGVASMLMLAIMLASGFVLSAFKPATTSESRLDEVNARGTLVMLTRNGASSYFIEGDEPTGPEYELVKSFADHLGVDLEVRLAGAFTDLDEMLARGEGDLIAANLSRTPAREQHFRFGPAYAETHTLVVYRKGLRPPQSLADLVNLRGAVLAGSSHEELMLEQLETQPELTWHARNQLSIEDLLQEVADGRLEYTLVDERLFRMQRRYYPGVRVAFEMGSALPLAWAFSRDNDDSLFQAASRYLTLARESGRMSAVQDAFFLEEERLGQLDMMMFQRRMRDQLPPFLPFFQEVAEYSGVDWRLLAAMGYQESHWDPLAASPTGVRGMMMLTLKTAEDLEINDRLDPLQSIRGGARYFLHMMDRLPERLEKWDRTWMALAAYNIGLGHLEDARRLTQSQGGDPDLWQEVRLRLPLLTQEKHHRNTRYGYARGYEAQQYVDNIQRFYDTLIWMDTRAHPLLARQYVTAP